MTSARVPSIQAVSNRRRLAPHARSVSEEVRALARWVADVVAAGVDAVQIREPGLPAATLYEVVRAAVALAAGSPALILVNDRADVALAADAHGVHAPARGLPPASVRRLRADWVVGRSVHAGDDPHVADGADYVVFGTVFASRSKAGGNDLPAGLDSLADAVPRFRCPVIAIGGVNPARAAECRQAGAAGVAAIGAFLPEGLEPGALGPTRAVTAFRAALGIA